MRQAWRVVAPVGLSLALALSGCASLGIEEPEVEMDTATMATATGGVIGAGLGAIIGSQTGDPGVGLVLGAAAGAGSGAMIGNALQSQEETLRVQEEALTRHGETIAAQRQELEALRRMNADTPGANRGSRYGTAKSAPKQAVAPSFNEPRASFREAMPQQRVVQQNVAEARALKEATIDSVVRDGSGLEDSGSDTLRNRPLQRQMLEELHSFNRDSQNKGGAAQMQPSDNDMIGSSESRPKEPPPSPEVGHGNSPGAEPRASLQREAPPRGGFSMTDSGACQSAQLEVDRAAGVTDPSDKLFHYRRALRLCPSRAEFHAGLAEVYETLGRHEDAAYEFREALSINPDYSQARAALKRLEQ